MIFDGRSLSGELHAGPSDAQPLEPTLTPGKARAEAGDTSSLTLAEASSDAEAPPSAEAPSNAASQGLAAEPSPESQSIGRIRLRKAELRPSEPSGERPPRAPSTRVDRAEPDPPASPRSLHEAFDSLELDRLAESIRSAWEAPVSRRVTPPGEDPEVTVHYPSAWQPPPSERRRMRASWEVTPTLPLSFAPPPSDTLDDGWEASASELAPASAGPAPAEASRAPESSRAETGPTLEPRILEPAATDSVTALTARAPAPESEARVGKSGGPGLESTAPTAISQSPPRAARSLAAKLWGAGLAAAALLALVWRGAGSAPEPTLASTEAPKPAATSKARARADSVPAAAPPAPAPTSETVEAVAPARAEGSPDVGESVSPPAAAAPGPAASPPPLPETARAPATIEQPPVPPRRSPLARESLAPTATPPPASEPTASPTAASAGEPTGPDPAEVARALGAAAAQARACSASDGPGGNGSIRVLLNPSGGVLNATALGGFQGTSTGACVENAFRNAPTPAYDGRSLSTVYPFSLIVD